MARLFQSAFELNSVTNGMEWTASQGSPTISSSVKRTGSYALQITGFTSGTPERLRYAYTGSSTKGPIYTRTYFRVDTLPSAANSIIAFYNSAGAPRIWIKVDNTGVLTLFDEDGQIGSASSALSTTTWYNIELYYDLTPAQGSQVITARLDGTIFATASVRNLSDTAGLTSYVVGGNINSEAQTTGDWFFDDIAINDSTGSVQNAWPGEGKILHLKPSAAGDVNGFLTQVGGTVGAGNNFTRVNEVPPDDVTSYNGSALLNAEDLFNCDNSGIGANDTVTVVAVGVRMADLVGADATAALKVEIEKTASGTKAQSGALIPNSTTWATNTAAAPRNYPLVTYADPDGAAWTQTTLDSMQIGYIQTATNVQTIAVSNVWASIDYLPALSLSVSDTITISESNNAALAHQMSVVDNITVSESLSIILLPLISLSDTITLTESLIMLLLASIAVSDAITVTESTNIALAHQIVVSENIAVSEALQVELNSFVSVSEAIIVSESLTLLLLAFFAISDSLIASEALLLMVENFILLSDSITVTEESNIALAHQLVVSETIMLAENVKVVLESVIQVSDTSTVSESTTMFLTIPLTASDIVMITETVNLLLLSFLSVSDAITASESSTVALVHMVAASDTITVSEVLGLSNEENILTADNVTISENIAVDSGAAFLVVVSDTVSVSEAQGMSEDIALQATDSLTLTEQVFFQPEYFKNQPFYYDIGDNLSIMLGPPRMVVWGITGRPQSPHLGEFGFNDELLRIEIWMGFEWGYLPLQLIPRLIALYDIITVSENVQIQIS